MSADATLRLVRFDDGAAEHVVILLGSDALPALRLYGAWCLDCGVKTAIGYPTPDKARASLDKRAGHVDSRV